MPLIHFYFLEALSNVYSKFEGTEHAALGVSPSYLSGSPVDAAMWDKVAAAPADYSEDVAAADIEGRQFRSTYDKDVQLVMARPNHHVHLPTKKGRVPLSACRAKG